MGNDTIPVDNSSYQPDLADMFMLIVAPIIILVGTVGNTLAIIVMKKAGKRFCGPCMSLFFQALATIDQIVLINGLSRKWVLSLTGFDIRDFHSLVCKLHKFVVFSGTRNTAWITVAITTQRVFAVVWPIGHKMYATKKTALVVIFVIVMLCTLQDIGVIIENAVNKGGKMRCLLVQLNSYPFFNSKINAYGNLATVYFLPSFMLLMNSLILVYKLNKDRFLKATKKLSVTQKMSVTQSETLSVTQVTKKLSRASRNSATLPSVSTPCKLSVSKKATSFSLISIAIAFLFMLLHATIPVTVLKIMLENDPLPKLEQIIFDLALFWCYAENFYLYMMTSSALRGKTKMLVCGRNKSIYESTSDFPFKSTISGLETSYQSQESKKPPRTPALELPHQSQESTKPPRTPALELPHQSQESTKPPHTPAVELPHQSQESNRPPQSPQAPASLQGQETLLQNPSTQHELHENSTCPQNIQSTHPNNIEDNESTSDTSIKGSLSTLDSEDKSSTVQEQTGILNILYRSTS